MEILPGHHSQPTPLPDNEVSDDDTRPFHPIPYEEKEVTVIEEVQATTWNRDLYFDHLFSHAVQELGIEDEDVIAEKRKLQQVYEVGITRSGKILIRQKYLIGMSQKPKPVHIVFSNLEEAGHDRFEHHEFAEAKQYFLQMLALLLLTVEVLETK